MYIHVDVCTHTITYYNMLTSQRDLSSQVLVSWRDRFKQRSPNHRSWYLAWCTTMAIGTSTRLEHEYLQYLLGVSNRVGISSSISIGTM